MKWAGFRRLSGVAFFFAVVLLPVCGRAGWRAYNDLLTIDGGSSAANVTNWTMHNQVQNRSSGRLKDFETGSDEGMPTVTVTMGPAGLNVSSSSAGGRPNPGTPAYGVFYDESGSVIVDIGPSNIYYGGDGWWQEIRFTGLDPAKTYTFVATAIRSSVYSTRKTLVSLLGSESAVNNSSDGPQIDLKTEATTIFRAGDNRAAGDIVRWDDIVPSPEGTFTVRSEATADSETRAYPLHGFMLEETGAAGNRAPVVDAGDYPALTWPTNRLQLHPDVMDDDPCGVGILTYQWSKVSGPGEVTFEPSAEVERPVAVFSEPGDYELMLQVWDEVPQEGSATVRIDMVIPLLGDFTGDNKVNWEDMVVFAAQWLDEQGSPADLNAKDGVNARDFAIVAGNWRIGEGATLVINEVLARNDLVNQDPQGEYDDWVEIYNGGEEAVDVGGMFLTDDLDVPWKWRIPSGNPAATTIAVDGYLLIWLDGDVDDTGLHAGFELSAGGEDVAMFDTDAKTLLDKVSFGSQTPDVSWGRNPDMSQEWMTLTPTPGATNNGARVDVVGDTEFSQDRGFYENPFEVAITCDTPGAIIRYTTDGSTPTVSNGSKYTEPVPITTTTMLRAFAYKSGWKASNVDTQTYIFLDDVIEQATNLATGAQVTPDGFPTSWGGATGDYQMDPDVVGQDGQDRFGGIYAESIRNDLKAVPTFSLVMDKDDFFGSSRGIYINEHLDGTERVCSIEYIDPNGDDGFQQNTALSMQGGVSGGGTSLNRWKTYKLSMRPRFKTQTDDGTPTGGAPKLDFKLFQDSPVDRHNTFVFDAVLNHSWLHSGQHGHPMYIQDQYVADLHNAMGGYSPHGFYAHVYICGLYWGMYYIHERPDHAWAAEVFGGDEDDYHSIKHNSGGVINNATGGSATSSFNSMVNAASAVGSDPENLSKWQMLESRLDVDNLITYLLANWFTGNHDWPHKNWYATCHNGAHGKWRFHSWDAEHTVEFTDDVPQSPYDLHEKLRSSEEYKIRFADIAQKAFFHGGPLSHPKASDLYRARMAQIDRAIVGESARWGDNRSSFPHDRLDWLETQNTKLSNNFPGRSNWLFNDIRGRGLYPSLGAPVFEVNGFEQHGGGIEVDDQITMEGSGQIYYTLDGEDPRLPGGAINSGHAVQYSGALGLLKSARVKARCKSGNTWSALSEAVFSVGPVAGSLRITEMMYNPADTGDREDPNTEYIELQNVGREAINLNMVRFANGVDFTFGDVDLGAGDYILVVAKLSAFEAKYGTGLNIAGEYAGRLDNGGEKVRLEDSAGGIIHNFRYRDGWYDLTDGQGFSLTTIDASATEPNQWDEKSTWRPSSAAGGSPGEEDSGALPALGSIRINEVLAHSHAAASDWIELHNTTDEQISIGGWFLSDDDGNFRKYEIAAGTYIDPCDYIVFREDMHFGNADDPGAHELFALSEDGETVYLHSGSGGELTGYVEEENFGASETNVAFGRHRKSEGTFNFVAMSVNTPGAPNAYPKVGPVVINEIMYHPPEGDSEYVELYNISGTPLQLEDWDDVKGQFVPWRLEDGGGIEFYFPAGTTIPADGYVLVVKDLDVFNSEYPDVPGNVQIFEWVEGRLDNGGEKVELGRPGDEDPVTGKRPYIRVDRVNYSDGSHPEGDDPWPVIADGYGLALARTAAHEYGNDVINWKASAASPGVVNP